MQGPRPEPRKPSPAARLEAKCLARHVVAPKEWEALVLERGLLDVVLLSLQALPDTLERRIGVPDSQTGNDAWKVLSSSAGPGR